LNAKLLSANRQFASGSKLRPFQIPLFPTFLKCASDTAKSTEFDGCVIVVFLDLKWSVLAPFPSA